MAIRDKGMEVRWLSETRSGGEHLGFPEECRSILLMSGCDWMHALVCILLQCANVAMQCCENAVENVDTSRSLFSLKWVGFLGCR
jgi:hypothetical protein